MQWTSRSAGAASLDGDAAELGGQRRGPLRASDSTPGPRARRRRAAPTRRHGRCLRRPARAPSGPAGLNGSAAISPGASVLSAAIRPSGSNSSVLAAPIAAARGVGSVARASAASLCGIVTLTPRKPACGSAATVSANSSGGPAAADSASRLARRQRSAAFWMAGERLWATGQPTTPSRVREETRAIRELSPKWCPLGDYLQRSGELPPRALRACWYFATSARNCL